MQIDLPIEMAYHAEQVIMVVPMKHPEKGIGYVIAPITREMLADQAPQLSNILDNVVLTFQTEGFDAE